MPREPKAESPPPALPRLPEAERRRRRRDLMLTAGVLLAFAAVLLVEGRIGSLPAALPFADSLLFLFLNALSVVLIVLLIYLIGRHLVKLVFERTSKKLLGVHILGERATELIHVGQSVLAFGGTIDYFIQNVFNYPTLTEAYKYAAYDGLGRAQRRVAG